METELILSVGGFPPLSARGCVQELTPVMLGSLRRTINGTLVYVGKPQQKYRSVIKCQDKSVLASEGLGRGSLVKVGCIQRLWQRVDSGQLTLERDPVEGSVAAVDTFQTPVTIKQIKDRTVEVAGKGYVSYRPWLTMRVMSFQLMTHEWGVKGEWKLELEEV